MGRQSKSGLRYFPFEVNLFSDIKIRKLMKKCSPNSILVYCNLLCLIYNEGYFLQYDKELPFIISENTGYDEDFINEVITIALDLDLFSKKMFLDYKILTSKGIQSRYTMMSEISRRISRITIYDLISSEVIPVTPIIPPISSEETPISSELNPINETFCAQTKLNKTKLNETKYICDETFENESSTTTKNESIPEDDFSKKKNPELVAKRKFAFTSKIDDLLNTSHNRYAFFDEEITRFINYWTELNKSETKMRFELQQTFQIGMRLDFWMNNAKRRTLNNAPIEDKAAKTLRIMQEQRDLAQQRIEKQDEYSQFEE